MLKNIKEIILKKKFKKIKQIVLGTSIGEKNISTPLIRSEVNDGYGGNQVRCENIKKKKTLTQPDH